VSFCTFPMSLRPPDIQELELVEFDLFADRIEALAKNVEG